MERLQTAPPGSGLVDDIAPGGSQLARILHAQKFAFFVIERVAVVLIERALAVLCRGIDAQLERPARGFAGALHERLTRYDRARPRIPVSRRIPDLAGQSALCFRPAGGRRRAESAIDNQRTRSRAILADPVHI